MYVTGPDGERYHSIQEMCESYGVKYITYKRRRESGLSIEESLTKMGAYTVIGPDGEIYNSIKDMCKQYGVNYNTFMSRRRIGASLKQALIRKSTY